MFHVVVVDCQALAEHPPTTPMIGSTETNKMRAPRMVTGEPDSLHHSLCSRHVKGDFIHTTDFTESGCITDYMRVVNP